MTTSWNATGGIILNDGGWIKLHRCIENCVLWNDPKKFQAWVYLLLHANHEDKKITIRGQVVEIKRGQFLTSKAKLAEKFGWHRNTVTHFLDILEREGMCTAECTTNYTLVTIENYGLYQDRDNPDAQQSVQRNVQRTVQRSVHKQECKELKNKVVVINNHLSDSAVGRDEIEQIITAWNTIDWVQPIRMIKSGTTREKLVKARVKENGLDVVLEAIDQVANAGSFARGQNGRGWTITFDWFIKPNNFIKVLEGNYTDKPAEAYDDILQQGGIYDTGTGNEVIDIY